MLNKAYIDLRKLRENALAIKGKLKKGVKLCAVVKADAYGHGACECANAIYDIADCFAVALVEEAVSLRLSGIDKDILVLIPPFDTDLFSAVRHGLTLSVSKIDTLRKIDTESKRQGRKTKVHIKVDTGMNRQGVKTLADLKELLTVISRCDGVILDGIFSHFANPSDKQMRKNALDKFLLANTLVKVYNNKVTSHISASGGFLSGVQADMVRVGILLYGYKPFDSDLVTVKPIMRVTAPIVDFRAVKSGESALYGKVIAKADKNLALVRYGYADGLFRKNIDGQFNNRCMDLTAVTEFDCSKEFTVMDDADVLADRYGTISYEILCRAACRAEKIYLR